MVEIVGGSVVAEVVRRVNPDLKAQTPPCMVISKTSQPSDLLIIS